MIKMNTAMIARAGAIDLIGRRAEERCTTVLSTQEDVEAIMNEVALVLFEEACRRRRSGLRGILNRIVGAWRRWQYKRHPEASGEFGARMHALYGAPTEAKALAELEALAARPRQSPEEAEAERQRMLAAVQRFEESMGFVPPDSPKK